jgi:hypothetical protein
VPDIGLDRRIDAAPEPKTNSPIVAPAGHHAVGTTLATNVIRLDRVPAMAIQVLYPPAES